jgi:hypothetical protein
VNTRHSPSQGASDFATCPFLDTAPLNLISWVLASFAYAAMAGVLPGLGKALLRKGTLERIGWLDEMVFAPVGSHRSVKQRVCGARASMGLHAWANLFSVVAVVFCAVGTLASLYQAATRREASAVYALFAVGFRGFTVPLTLVT